MYRPINDYAIIGDSHTAALISTQGSIDWVCFPYFDSPALFLRLLDDKKGGFCALEFQDLRTTTRRYLEGTAILETTITTVTGTLTITDFMPTRRRQAEHPTGDSMISTHRIIRLLRCTSGSVTGAMAVKPTFVFATEKAAADLHAPGILSFTARTDALHVHCPCLSAEPDGSARACFALRASEILPVVLTYAKPQETVPVLNHEAVQQLLAETRHYWQEWSQTCAYQGEYCSLVLRSALTLKLLTFAPTGAIIAAPTTSLPEEIGGQRNWDYRFTWMRDATFTLIALMNLGYFDEAHDFSHFLRRTHTCPTVNFQILYTIDGKCEVREEELPHLDGYRGSRPVRIGNAAAGQKQLDIYGELVHCLYLYSQHGGFTRYHESFLTDVWPLVEEVAQYVVHHWREPDRGIWEVRGGDRHFVSSKAMCWVALDRALRLTTMARREKDFSRWRRERDAIMESVLRQGFNADVGAFVQFYGSTALDASLLRLPLLGVIKAADPRMCSTIEQISRHLVRNGLVYRHRNEDGVPGDEGTFAICTFWLIQNYILLGRVVEAEELFAHVLSFANDVGLFAEELDPLSGEQLGNFPQGFTHIALIDTAVRLDAAKRGKKATAHAIVEDREEGFA